MIRFERVTFGYGGTGSRPAVADLTFQVAAGERVVVLGANGSGKSTLVRLMTGLLLPRSGSVFVDDRDTRDASEARFIRSSVGVVFQNPDDQIVATSVEDDVAFGPENLGLARAEIRRRVDNALSAVDLTGLERREPHLLSGGQKQRLAIAGVLALDPRYIVMDEPTSMLDPHGRIELLGVLDRLAAEGHGIVQVTHDLVEAVSADRVVVLSEGMAVFDGTAQQLLALDELPAAWSLERPPIVVLSDRLRALGVPVPTRAATPQQVVEALCL